MDVGVREPTEVIEDDMALVDDVRLASHIEVPPVIFELESTRTWTPNVMRSQRFSGGSSTAVKASICFVTSVGGFYKPHVDRADLPAWPPAARRAVAGRPVQCPLARRRPARPLKELHRNAKPA